MMLCPAVMFRRTCHLREASPTAIAAGIILVPCWCHLDAGFMLMPNNSTHPCNIITVIGTICSMRQGLHNGPVSVCLSVPTYAHSSKPAGAGLCMCVCVRVCLCIKTACEKDSNRNTGRSDRFQTKFIHIDLQKRGLSATLASSALSAHANVWLSKSQSVEFIAILLKGGPWLNEVKLRVRAPAIWLCCMHDVPCTVLLEGKMSFATYMIELC